MPFCYAYTHSLLYEVCDVSALYLTKGKFLPIGPESNEIVGILESVNWEELAQQLKLNQINSIHETCKNERKPLQCKLREVLRSYINSQTAQPCCETVMEIANALERLPVPNVNIAGKLREMCIHTGLS